MTRANDIVSEMFPASSKYIVVIMEPTIMYLPGKGKLLRRAMSPRKRAAEYMLNDKMCTWIVWYARQFSMPVHIWSFLPIEIFDLLTPRIEAVCGEYINEWDTFNSEREARARLRADQDIVTVYDADVDRVEWFWQFRGSKVPLGGTP